MWDKFIYEFCKVQFLCYEWEPNWLGWILISAVFGIALLAVFVGISLIYDYLKTTDVTLKGFTITIIIIVVLTYLL